MDDNDDPKSDPASMGPSPFEAEETKCHIEDIHNLNRVNIHRNDISSLSLRDQV